MFSICEKHIFKNIIMHWKHVQNNILKIVLIYRHYNQTEDNWGGGDSGVKLVFIH